LGEHVASIFGVEEEAMFASCFHAGFLLGLFFDPEDGCDIFF
jgi:hypothetical protein